METDLQQQAESIRTLLAQYDIDVLLAPLMEKTVEADAETKDK
jgi:hypothetical protein